MAFRASVGPGSGRRLGIGGLGSGRYFRIGRGGLGSSIGSEDPQPLFRGRPVLSLGDLGALHSGLGCLGLVVRVDWVGMHRHRVRGVLMSSGFGDESRVGYVVCNLEGWS